MDCCYNPFACCGLPINEMRECSLDYRLFDPEYKPQPRITEPRKESEDSGLLVSVIILLTLIVIGEMIK